MLPLILTLVVASQFPDPFVPTAPRGELAAPEGPAASPIAEASDGPSVPYPAGDLRAELLSPEIGATLLRFVVRHGLAVLTLGVVAFGVLGGYVAMAKRRPIAEGLVIGSVFGPVGVVVVGLLPSKGQGAAS